MQCSLKCGVVLFFVSDNFQRNFVDFCFLMFAQVLMKVLARILIYVRKFFNCRISIKMLFSMCLKILEKELWTNLWSSNFQNGTFEKLPLQSRKTLSSKYPFLTLVLNKKIKMDTRNNYHGIFMPFKSQAYSKHGSPNFLLFGSWSLVSYIHSLVKAKFWQT